MEIVIYPDKSALGQAAAREGAQAIQRAIATNGEATIIVATGASQFEMLEHLMAAEIDWSKVTAFHLDEYAGLGVEHPASFVRYLRERFVSKAPGLKEFVEVDGAASDIGAEIARLNARIAGESVDVCFAGFGENCHLAFNDPPADFETETPYLLVTLDAACRQQQFGEGWFATLADVPAKAVSMSVRQIMKSKQIVLSVPDQRKAVAAKAAIEGPVSPLYPASILQQHPNVTAHLDPNSASLLSKR